MATSAMRKVAMERIFVKMKTKCTTIGASITREMVLKVWNLFIEQPFISRLGVISTTERSQTVSITVEIKRPTDKKNMRVGKEMKTQNDLFGTSRHVGWDAFE